MTEAKEESWGQYLRRHWIEIILPMAFIGWMFLNLAGYTTLRTLYFVTLVIMWGAIKVIQWRRRMTATKLL